MTRLNLIASATLIAGLLGAGQAFAQEATSDSWQTLQTSVSRDSVRLQAQAALRAGQIESGEATLFSTELNSTLSRTQVLAEARAARQLGLLDAGEVSAPSATPAQARAIADAGRRAITVSVAQAR